MKEKIAVIIYSKPGCCLCDEAKAAIESSRCRSEVDLTEVNIESDTELFARFQYEIPVIFIAGRKAFKYHVTGKDFCARLRRHQQGAVITDEE